MAKRILLYSNTKTIETTSENDTIKVFIDGHEYKFDEPDNTSNEKKEEHAQNQKRNFYSTFLSNHFENLVVLSGAGTSVGWGGKTMKELWSAVEIKLTPAKFEIFAKAIGFIGPTADFSRLSDDHKDLEKLLSRANIAKEFIKEYNGEAIDIPQIVSECESVIHIHCKLNLTIDAPHEQFLNKVTNRKLKDPRVKIFTLNYDTLFEQAAIKGNFTVIDGFSFSLPRTLSGRNFDHDIVYREKSRIKEEESFVPKVFHLYKPHGSVNWELQEDTERIIISPATTKPLMIFPKDSKYENSYEQPFFEMMSRFQQNLRNDNVLLICVGFSFNDKHIVTAIKEAVSQNPSFRLMIVSRTIRETTEIKWFIDKAKHQYNVTLVAEEFTDFAKHYPASKIYSTEQRVLISTENDSAAVRP
jgi:NAD-dependent SIR2 family protein deacetylase